MKQTNANPYFRRLSRIIAAAFLFAGCTHLPTQLSGGGSDTEVSGKILSADGTAKPGVAVALIAQNYDPAFDGNLPPHLTAVTDAAGKYRFDSLDRGIYNLQATLSGDGTKILVNSITVDSGIVNTLQIQMLKKTATLIVPVPDSLAKYSGFINVPGTLLWKSLSANARSAQFDSVPQGTLSSIIFQKNAMDSGVVLYSNIVISSPDTFTLNPWLSWAHAAKIMLNTTVNGANAGETELNFPLLIRLTSLNFNFKQAKPKGEDIRFVRQDNSVIPYEIEWWDTTTSVASIWVKVDTVYAHNNNQFITMLWGNSAAKTNSSSSAVFDTAQGFQGVWHLGQSGGTTQVDATANHFDGTPSAMTGASDVTGNIGRAQNFNGSTQYITVLNSSNSRLDVQTETFYTVSSWVYASAFNQSPQVFLSKGSAQYGLMINAANRWEFYGGQAGYGVDTTTSAPAAANVWTLVTGVRSGMKQYLYVNGVVADSTPSAAGADSSISNNFYDFVIGRQSDNQSQWFDGIIDEVRVENQARSAGWNYLCYQNQRSDQIMVQVIPVK